jgi:predicted dehydrogenase
MFRFLRRPSPANENAFGIALVGLGHGAEKMCAALADSSTVRVSALVSSSAEKAARFHNRFRRHLGDVQHYTYDQLPSLAANASIDAVYLALPVALHRPFAEQAARAGKYVLCEKPIASSIADAEAMIAACRDAGRLLMVAYRLDYDPMHAEAARLLASGQLGAVRRVRSSFGIVAKEGWRFDSALAGGGSLFDVGVYPIHALHNFFPAVEVTHAAILEDPATHMELDAIWSGTLPGGASFLCESSYLRRIPDELHFDCEHGTLSLLHAFAYERTELRFNTAQRKLRLRDSSRNPSLFRLEAEHLAACARTGLTLRSPGESGLRDLETVARIEALASRKPR